MAKKKKVPKPRNPIAQSLFIDSPFYQRVAKKAHPRDIKPQIKDFDDD